NYWVGIRSTVGEFIAKCDPCQRNAQLSRSGQPLKSMPVSNKVWHTIGADLIGPLPVTPRSNRYIATAVDLFSKWPEAQALPDKSAASVHSFLFGLICRHGCSQILITDQGREFVNEINFHLMKRTGTDHRMASAYHPQTNGQVERFNQTLKDS